MQLHSTLTLGFRRTSIAVCRSNPVLFVTHASRRNGQTRAQDVRGTWPNLAKCWSRSTASIASPGNSILPQPQDSESPPLVQPRHEHDTPPIGNLQDLEYEADVTGTLIPGKPRLVDSREYRFNHVLWSELLGFRSSLSGPDGIKEIWRGMRSRGVDIPTYRDSISENMWKKFLSTALTDAPFLEEIWDYAKKWLQRRPHYQRWEALYFDIMNHMLRYKPDEAFEWHLKLHNSHGSKHGQLSKLIGAATSSLEALDSFKEIYALSKDERVYDVLIPRLCKQTQYKEALSWHNLLVPRGDIPSNEAVVDQLKKFVSSVGDPGTAKSFQESLIKAGVSFAGHVKNNQRSEPLFAPQEKVFKIMGMTFGYVANGVSDGLAARVFATRSFSPDFAINVLTTFGLEILGPLALRELAVRCSCSQELESKIGQLHANGIELDESLYVRLVDKLARDNNWPILQAVLSTDQHPDVFEDQDTQKRLLTYYIKQQDWLQAHMTLVILTAFRARPSTWAWNYVLVSCIESHNFRMMNLVLDDMLFMGVDILPSTVRRSFFLILNKRNPGKRPGISQFAFDDLSFLTTTWLKIVRAGSHIPPSAWNQILTYFGMTGRLGELERLSIWLALLYSTSTSPSLRRKLGVATRRKALGGHQDSGVAANDGGSSGARSAIKQVFSLHKKKAMISWGFKTLSDDPMPKTSRTRGFADAAAHMADITKTNATSTSDWERGILLLRRLQILGVRIDLRTVSKTFRYRLDILFGQGISRRTKNRAAREKNQGSPIGMTRCVNRIFNLKRLGLPRHVLKSKTSLRKTLLESQPRERVLLQLQSVTKSQGYRGRIRHAALLKRLRRSGGRETQGNVTHSSL